MIIAGYFEDDASNELTNDPVFKSVLEKNALASQPTVSRFFSRMDEDTLNQFLVIGWVLRKKIYSIQMPPAVILDLDSTLLDAYGRQEGRAFNFHYQSNGFNIFSKGNYSWNKPRKKKIKKLSFQTNDTEIGRNRRSLEEELKNIALYSPVAWERRLKERAEKFSKSNATNIHYKQT